MTVDGVPLAEVAEYAVDEVYTSYEDARARYVPRMIQFTSQAGTQAARLDLLACQELMARPLGRLIEETDDCGLDAGGVDCASGTCSGVNGTAGFAARRGSR